MQLTKKELNRIHSLIKLYKRKYEEIGNLEKTLKKLSETRNQIKKQIEDIREEEKIFGEDLVKKYGKGKFDLQTFEYTVEK